MARRINHEKANKTERVRKSRKPKDETPTPDHNEIKAALDTQEAQDAYQEYEQLMASMEERMGEYMADIKNLFERAAPKLGLSREIVGFEFRERRRETKVAVKRAMRSPHERKLAKQLKTTLGELGEAAVKARIKELSDAAAAEGDAAE